MRNNRLKYVAVVLSGSLVLLISCQKELSCPDCGSNKPPVAVAGHDQQSFLPRDSVALDGSASYDPDGAISSWYWTNISGPALVQINNARSTQTIVSDMKAGVYHFVLTVTDDGGLTAKDTVQVTIDRVARQGPAACAGADTVITLPTNSVVLEYECPWDYHISTLAWTKIAGPSSHNIINANAARAEVTDLVQGNYHFQLKVTGLAGLSSMDTVQVTVLPATTVTDCNGIQRQQVNARLVSAGYLSQARAHIAVAAAGNKIVFAGGANEITNEASSRVDILDLQTNAWSTAELSHPTWAPVCAVLNNKIYFAGALVNGELSSTVDIYDAVTNSWSMTNIPELARRDGFFIGMITAAAAGNKVLFLRTKTVDGNVHRSYSLADIYDITTNTWRTDTLHNRTHTAAQYIAADAAVSATTIGNRIYLAGNASDWFAIGYGTISGTIDIYDAGTGSWSSSTLNEARGGMGAIASGNKNYWAGGVNSTSGAAMWTSKVEIRDIHTGSSTYACLAQANAFFSAVEKNDDIIFFTSYYGAGSGVPNNSRNKFDIYRRSTNTWSVGLLPVDIYSASVISANNTIYVAGGKVNGMVSTEVYKLEF